MKLDKRDKEILEELQKNCKQSSRQLGKKLGIPATTVHQRIKKLEKAGIILDYHIKIDPDKVGLPTTAIVLIRITPRLARRTKLQQKKVVTELAKNPYVQEAHIITGAASDVILKVVGKNEREIGNYVVEKLRNVPEIQATQTCMRVFTAKDTHKIPIELK